MNRETLNIAMRFGLIPKAALFAVLLAGGVGFVVLPLFQENRLTLEEIAAQRTAVQEIEKQMSALGDLDAAVQEQTQSLQRLRAKMLGQGQHARVISIISKTAKDEGLTLAVMKPLPPPKATQTEGEEGVRESLFLVEAESGYKQLGRFIDRLRSAELMLHVHELRLRSMNRETGTLRAEVIIAAFKEHEVKGEDVRP